VTGLLDFALMCGAVTVGGDAGCGRLQASSQVGEGEMAQKVTVALEDDLDGGRAAETLRFAFGGADYEIDLSKKNAAAFRKQLLPFVEHARKTGRAQSRRRGHTVANRRRSGDIRAWAKGQGIAVSERGRIPASVIAQYQATGG
jgi:hypothetical protein